MFLQIFTDSVFCSILSHVYSDPPICGGDINVDENGGNITSPNYPKHYPSGTRCEWVLTAPDNMQVILKFLSFQLEDDTQTRNTCVDYVEIRDGGRANSPILGSYCGNESLHEVRSTRNELSVRFTSDYSKEYKGFLATYSSGNPNATIGIQGPLKGSLFDNIHATAVQGKDLILHLGSFATALDISLNTNELEYGALPVEMCNKSGRVEHSYPNSSNLIYSKWGEECISLNYSSDQNVHLKATFNISGTHIYGGLTTDPITWPVEKVKTNDESLATSLFSAAVVEPYWLLSNGYYIYVDWAVPLFKSQDEGILRLTAKNEKPYIKSKKLALNLNVCKLKNARQAQEHAIRHFLGKPATLPDVSRVTRPAWSTWIPYANDIDEEKLLNFAKNISSLGLAGLIQIEHPFECSGSYAPDPKRFPNFTNSIGELKKLNFTVALMIQPSVNANCRTEFTEGRAKDFFVKDINNVSYVDSYKDSLVDFTNPSARSWFIKKAEFMRETYGIDGFKFNTGELYYLPKPAIFHEMADDHPNTIVKAAIKLLANLSANTQTRVAAGNQQYGLFRTMPAMRASWSDDLGLKSTIPTLLKMNILGYSFVTPDLIGGGYEEEYNAAIRSKELYIRWLQLSVFMPSMTFSLPPWRFDDPQVTVLTKKFVDLHARYSQDIIQLMKENVRTGAPVNPPIWWIAPNDSVALTCDSEFLLGEDILVAPVLDKGEMSRDIYLPEGLWVDQNKINVTYQGPMWLTNYAADLNVLPYFQRIRV